MKKRCTLLAIISLFFTSQLLAQDIIVTIPGDSISCKVVEITEKTIKYSFIGETMLNNINKVSVAKIKFENGRVQEITEKIIIAGEEDWNKIHITNSPDDVVGLTKVKEYTEKSMAISSSEAKAKAKVLEKAKREAAKDQCHVLLIISFSSTRGAGIMADSRANIVAIGYKY